MLPVPSDNVTPCRMRAGLALFSSPLALLTLIVLVVLSRSQPVEAGLVEQCSGHQDDAVREPPLGTAEVFRRQAPGAVCASMLLQRQAGMPSRQPAPLEEALGASSVSLMTLSEEVRPRKSAMRSPRRHREKAGLQQMDARGIDDKAKIEEEEAKRQLEKAKKEEEEVKEEDPKKEEEKDRATDAVLGETDAGLGETAPLSQKGYSSVAKLKNGKQMEAFIRRAIAQNNLKITDTGALAGFVPYYSGKKATQSFDALEKEIHKASKITKNPWLVKETAKVALTGKGGSVKAASIAHQGESPKMESKPSRMHWKVGSSSLRSQETHQAKEGKHKEKKNKTGSVSGHHKFDAREKKVEDKSEKKKEKAASDEMRGRARHALVQTEATREASSRTGWFQFMLGALQGQALWMGLRVTIVACLGSLLFGLFVFNESAHQVRLTDFDTPPLAPYISDELGPRT